MGNAACQIKKLMILERLLENFMEAMICNRSDMQKSSIVLENKSVCKPRNIGLDIIRSFAILFVIAGHFLLNTSFNSSIFYGYSLFIQAMAKMLFIIGVPLFILLTGYLNSEKSINKKYYRAGLRVIISYLLFSVVTILIRHYYLHEHFSWIQWGLKILDFSAIPYAWYIEMWIGLYLFTPFLNLLYKAIPTWKQKVLWLIILFMMTAVPDLLNRYGLHLVPNFWKTCYPLLFFFIGCFIKEYQLIIKPLYGWG